MKISEKLAAWQTRLWCDGWALVPLRWMIGFGFAAHGYAKLARGPEHFAAILLALGIPAPSAMAWLTTLLELCGGASLLLGAAVTPLSVPLGVIMLTALFGVHFQYGFSSIRLKAIGASGAEFGPVGYELSLLYCVALVTLAISEPSRLSFDRWFAGRRRRDAPNPPTIEPQIYSTRLDESPSEHP